MPGNGRWLERTAGAWPDAIRLAQWDQQNAERIAPMSPGERQEMFRSEELLMRYRAGLPARDGEEREAYQEWRQLDADVVNEYTEAVEIPERLWDEYAQSGGPLGRDEFFVQYFRELSQEGPANERAECRSVPGTDAAQSVGSSPGFSAPDELESELPGAADVGRRLREEPIVHSVRTPYGKGGAKAAAPLLDSPIDPGSSDPIRLGGASGPEGLVLRL
jgi:hypothetical protein